MQRSNRLVLMLSDGEVAAIQDYRFSNRVGSKAGAARHLIEVGLLTEKKEGAAETAISPRPDHCHPVEGKAHELEQH